MEILIIISGHEQKESTEETIDSWYIRLVSWTK